MTFAAPDAENSNPCDFGHAEPELPADWNCLVSSLHDFFNEGLVPLFLLHFKRGQPWLPLASLAAALDAAGGAITGAGAGNAVRMLANACPDSIVLTEESVSTPLKVRLNLASAPINDDVVLAAPATRMQPARCGGVVAEGFSLALPALDEEHCADRELHDPQGKRWRRAQGGFYSKLGAIEDEIARLRPRVRQQLIAYAHDHRAEEPPRLDAQHAVTVRREAHSARTAAETSMDEAAAPSLSSFLDDLMEHSQYKQQICHVERYPPRPAKYVSFNELVDSEGKPLLSHPTLDALHSQLGIERLFEHQFTALQAVRGHARHLCLTTGTSSGKSLAFALPILEDFRRNPNLRAIIMFPTKALAQDQLGKLKQLFRVVCPALNVCTFDGDTPKMERASLLQNCHVFLTNPDMLHFSILAYHKSWRHVFENLKYVVLDEAHVYRATFGTHVALLMRRFRRALHHYGASPLFIACSATMVNAGAFFMQLLGLRDEAAICVVDTDTAGRGERKFCLWNPPPLEQEGDDSTTRKMANARKRARFSEREGNNAAPRLPPGVGYKTRASAFHEAAWLLAEAVRRNHRTVCFLQVRSMVEIVLQTAHDLLDGSPALQKRIAAYRGGYSAVDRRKLERRLFDGDLIGVAATNALELGIDIGDLDMTIHVGVPPTVASVWQQAGRAGRRGRPSVAVLVAHDAPLEQHFCNNPRDFFQRTLEARLPDVANQFLLHGHALCAAVELQPFTEAEALKWFGDAVLPALRDCKREGRLVAQVQQFGERDASTAALRHFQRKGRKTPKEEVSLRDIDPVQFQVLVRGSTVPLETLDQKLAFMKLHPGALYLNQQKTFFVEDLDLEARIARVVPRDPKTIDYYTECREHSQIIIQGGGNERDTMLPKAPAVRAVLRTGAVTHRWQMYGFRKKAKNDQRILDQVDLSLPAVEYATQAVWMDLPGAVLQPVSQAGHSVDRGGLHALEHAMLSLAPLCADLEACELSCQHTRRDSDANRYLLLLFETQKGGAGMTGKLFEHWETLLRRAVRLIEQCPCEGGCPKCIINAHCGEYNHGLDKRAALMIGHALGLCESVPTFDFPSLPADSACTRVDFHETSRQVAGSLAPTEESAEQSCRVGVASGLESDARCTAPMDARICPGSRESGPPRMFKCTLKACSGMAATCLDLD